MEALLLSAMNCFPELILSADEVPKVKKNGKIKHLEEWTLAELIRVAENLNWLPSSLSPKEEWDTAKAKIGDYVKLLQQVRNLIHPVRYAKELGRKRVTKKYLDACFNIVDNAAVHLSEVINTNLSILTEEMEGRTSK